MKAREAVFTAVDFESTGSVAGWEEEPWQIGVAEVAGGAPTGVLADGWLGVAAGRPFNPYAPGRHAQVRAELAAADDPYFDKDLHRAFAAREFMV